MENRAIILHLSLIPGVGSVTIQKILAQVNSDISIVYDWHISDWKHAGFSEKESSNLYYNLKNRDLLLKEQALLSKYAISYRSIADDDYPSLLKYIYAPPAILYIKGELVPTDFCMAIVGSRNMSPYGKRVIQLLVPELIACNMTIVSGGARGIDSIAHQVSLDHNGRTIAVLGSGILRPYPKDNIRLFEDIVHNGGALLSPFALETYAQPGHFPARNTIISGLSKGVIVAQAAIKSGALITAYTALEQGKDVFAVPGPIDDERSIGCHRLIQQGAKLVQNASDILQEYPMVLPTTVSDQIVKLSTSNHQMLHVPTLDDQLLFFCAEARFLDEILAHLPIEYHDLQEKLFNMQLSGKIYQKSPGLWIAV